MANVVHGPYTWRISYEISLKDRPSILPISEDHAFTIFTKNDIECNVATIHQSCVDNSETYKYEVDGSDKVTFDMKLTSSCAITYSCTCNQIAPDCTSFCDDFFDSDTGIFEMVTDDKELYKPGDYIVTLTGYVAANSAEMKT